MTLVMETNMHLLIKFSWLMFSHVEYPNRVVYNNLDAKMPLVLTLFMYTCAAPPH